MKKKLKKIVSLKKKVSLYDTKEGGNNDQCFGCGKK